MLDTISLTSPFLSEEVAKKIENISIQRSGVDFEVGELLYIFTTKLIQAYPSLKYDDIKTDYFYPLYPDFRG